jgi:hypothetical protein
MNEAQFPANQPETELKTIYSSDFQKSRAYVDSFVSNNRRD